MRYDTRVCVGFSESHMTVHLLRRMREIGMRLLKTRTERGRLELWLLASQAAGQERATPGLRDFGAPETKW